MSRPHQADIQIEGAADHGVSGTIYLRDPDENGVEHYWDKPKDQWPYSADGSLAMVNDRLELGDLLAELGK